MTEPEPNNIFERMYTWVETLLENGTIHAWFKWVEWVTLTSVLITSTVKINYFWGKYGLGLVTFVLIVFLRFSGIIVVNKTVSNLLNKLPLNDDSRLLLVFGVALVVPIFLMYGLVAFFLTLVP